MKKLEKILLVGLIACIACNFITGLFGKSHIFGFKPMIVMSGSMEPTLRTYQLIVTVPVTAQDIFVNDIVTYKSHAGLTIVHRVIAETAEGYVFKGDNNPFADADVVTADQIGYKVIWH